MSAPSTTPALTRFSTLVDARQRAGDTVHLVVTDDWLQGRTCYGGLISALAVQAMRDVAGQAWPADVSLRGLQTCFVGPVAPGEVQTTVRVLRQGRHVCQVQAQVQQGDQVAAALLGVFSADRPSALQTRRPLRAAPRLEADELPPPPPRPHGAPLFLQHFEMRWAEGPPPYTGGEGWVTRIHMRMNAAEAASVPPELQTVLLADLSPTPAIGQLTRPSANSSVTWALELRPVTPATPEGWWLADNESLMVEGGYVNQYARLWAPGGQLAAFGTQVVAVFA
jgi:acyl-CoA thioesterase